jgi:hypothetical protein
MNARHSHNNLTDLASYLKKTEFFTEIGTDPLQNQV